MTKKLDPDEPLNRFFIADVARELTALGLESLYDLLDFIYEDPSGWWKKAALREERANGITVWICQKKSNFVDLPEELEKRAAVLARSAFNSGKIEKVGAPRWEEVVSDGRPKRALGHAVEESDVKPLEFLAVPEDISGANGKNRADKEHCALEADKDKEAIRLWLKAKGTNTNTQNAYRREAERFLLWCILEKHIPLSSALLEDCSDYLRWLEMLGRTPENDWAQKWRYPQQKWIGAKNTPRSAPDWRPFNCALSYTSRRVATTILRQLFNFLHKTGYLKFNPFDQLSAKVPLLPGEGKPKEFADRSLTDDQWKAIRSYLETLEDGIVKRRLEVILLLGKELGMRASEMVNARCGWIHMTRFGDDTEVLVIDIMGKGDKERRLPLSEDQENIINRYLDVRNRPLLHDPAGKDLPILGSLKPGKKGFAHEGLTRSGLYMILQAFLNDAASFIKKTSMRDAAKLKASSLHWLRHTFAVSSLKVMPVNIVQNAMGHASVSTTTRYISPDQKEIFEGFKRLRQLERNN